MENEEKKSLFDEAKETLEQTIGDRLLLAKMETAEKLAIISGKLVLWVAASLFLFFALFFISLMAGYYFSDIFSSLFLGFGLVALFYVLLAVLAFTLGKKYLVPKIESTIIETIFNDDAK